MKNYGKHVLASCFVVFAATFMIIFYFLYEFRFELEFYIYASVAFLVVIASLMGGSLVGLITSIFAIFAYAATYLYTTIQSSSYFDISFEQGLWMLLYLALALLVGKIGDGLTIYINLLKKHPDEVKELLEADNFNMSSERGFEDAVNNEMIRSRRMKASFCTATFSLEELPEIVRVFGEKGVYMCMSKVKFYLRTVFRKSDKVVQSNPSTISVLFPEIEKDQLIKRLIHLQRQLDNSYIEYKGTTIKYPIVVTVGVATFPNDGHDIFQLREAVDNSKAIISVLEKNYQNEDKKEKTHTVKKIEADEEVKSSTEGETGAPNNDDAKKEQGVKNKKVA